MDEFELVSQAEISNILKRVNLTQLAGKRILITGASGMVGSYLTETITKSSQILGIEMPHIDVLVRNLSSKNLATLATKNLVNPLVVSDISKFMHGEYDYVIHMASPASPTQYGDVAAINQANAGFINNFFESGSAETFMFISSGEVYGPQPPEGLPESFHAEFDPQHPRSSYPLAKIEAENSLLSQETNPKIVRLFHTFGPGLKKNDGRSFADFIWAAAQNNQIILKSQGLDLRTFLYLEDTIVGLLLVLLSSANFPITNVGSSQPTSIASFAKVVSKVAGVEEPRINDKSDIEYFHSPNKAIIPSNTRLTSLGWSQEVELEDSISRTLHWAKQQLKD